MLILPWLWFIHPSLSDFPYPWALHCIILPYPFAICITPLSLVEPVTDMKFDNRQSVIPWSGSFLYGFTQLRSLNIQDLIYILTVRPCCESLPQWKKNGVAILIFSKQVVARFQADYRFILYELLPAQHRISSLQPIISGIIFLCRKCFKRL